VIDPGLADAVRAELGAGIVSSAPVRGGDNAASHRLDLDDGRVVFLKTAADPPPWHFSTEAAGLRWLAAADALPVPDVLAVSDGDDAVGVPPHLLLEWIDSGVAPPDEAAFGRSLAALHRSGAPCFGREDRRPTGSRGLPNDPCDDWATFFATRRLVPLAELAERTGALPRPTIHGLHALAVRLADLGGPPEPAARLHGDLWAGNRVVDSLGRSWLVDPAAHGGHREFDLAMMRLFGGFGAEAFAAHQEAHPLADGWEERVLLHQVAPLVVHAVRFGGPYVAAANHAVHRYR